MWEIIIKFDGTIYSMDVRYSTGKTYTLEHYRTVETLLFAISIYSEERCSIRYEEVKT